MLKQYPLVIRVTFLILLLILFFYGIEKAYDFLAPLCLAILFSYLLYPFVEFLERKKVHRILAILMGIILLLIIISGILYVIIKQVQGMLTDFPTLKSQAYTNIELLFQFIQSKFGIDPADQEHWLKANVTHLFETGSLFLKKTFSATTGTFFKMVILPVFIFYFLYYRDHFRKFIMKVVPESKRNMARAIMLKTSRMTVNYMSGVFIVILILSVLNTIGLSIVGIKYAATFGIISALFNFIPYFGNWIGAFFPFIFALLTGDSPNLALGVIIYYVIVQFLEHNVLTPTITGGYVKLNPLFTIIGIILAGMVWGIVGMFIVIPLMGAVKIVFDYFEPTQPYGFLMGIKDTDHEQVRWSRIKKIFNRKKRG